MLDKSFYRVLYTKHLVKKKKTYHDGFLTVSTTGGATLVDDGGQLLGTTRLPAKSLPLPIDTEGLDEFEGFLVNVDEPCAAADLPGRTSPSNTAGSQNVTGNVGVQQEQVAAVPNRAALQKRRAFKPPAVVQRIEWQVPQPVLPIAKQPDAHLRPITSPAVVATMRTDGQRTDDDVLQLFGCSNSPVGRSLQNTSYRQQAQHSQQLPYDSRGPTASQQASLAGLESFSTQQPWQPLSSFPSAAKQGMHTAHAADDTAVAAASHRWLPQPSTTPIRDGAAAHSPGLGGTADLSLAVSDDSDDDSARRMPATEPQRGFTASPEVVAKRQKWACPRFSTPAASQMVQSGGSCQPQDGSLRLAFPGPQAEPLQCRECAIPDTFAAAEEYLTCCSAATVEDMNVRIAEVARRFHACMMQCTEQRMSPGDTITAIRRAGLPYYADAELACFPARPDDNKPEATFLTLNSAREPSKDFRQDDLWVLSSSCSFEARAKGGPCDRLRMPWVGFARSRWHGPNRDGRMQIAFVGKPPLALRRKQAVHALRVLDAGGDLAILDALGKSEARQLPLLPALMQPPAARLDDWAEGSTAPCAQQARDAAQRHGLNAEQSEALLSTAAWFGPTASKVAPVCVIHGPFGSGKSSLLVAMLEFFAGILPKSGRVLVAAHTNLAVDRVLLGLLEHGFTDFMRLGSLRRIDKQLLPHTLHARTERGAGDAAAELHAMLKTCTCPNEATLLRRELAELKAGAETKRRRRLKSVPVVGVTCCSATVPLLDGMAFDVCLLDECSQITEPLSLLTLSRAQCKYLVAAGDPCQLPPVISSPAAVRQSPGQPLCHGLARPLLVRLQAMGHASHLLRRQYRCHPTLSATPNRLFYGGRLLDGCAASDRTPLVAGVPEISCVHAPGDCHADPRSQSCSNRSEAAAVAKVVRRLMAAGVEPQSIGVICFYRAQVELIRSLLAAGPGATVEGGPNSPQATVATVDSFQGMEKEVIVLSPAVTRPAAFSGDAQRLNVALTRARRHLVIVADLRALPSLSKALELLLQRAAGLPGGICDSLAAFLPRRLPPDCPESSSPDDLI